MTWWLLWSACTDDPTRGRPADTGERPSGDRPLCAEEPRAPLPSFAPDLRAWATALAESDNRYFGERQWRALEAKGQTGWTEAAQEVEDRIVRGWSRLKFGDLDGAITDLQRAEALAAEVPGQTGLQRARQLLGAAWLRKAETVNCLPSGSGESCIVPFEEGAVHVDPTMMASAGDAFERSLAADADQPAVRWLDNVTYMARGTWPDEAPAAHVLPASFLETEGPMEGWSNVLPGMGLKEPTLAGGAALEDFDGDGLLDLLVSSMDAVDGMDLWLNEGDGGFCRASDASGVSSIPGLLSFSPADYDNDGDVDVFGPRGGWLGEEGAVRPSLLRNDGHGRFTDVAVAAGLSDPALDGPTQVAAWGDVDGDGWLDVFVGRELGASSLFRSRGDGTFVDVARDVGLAQPGWVKGAAWLDVELDGDLDLMVSVFLGPNHLYENRGGTFVDVTPRAMTEPIRSFPVAPLDYDQDGRQDLYVAAFAVNPGGTAPLDPDYFRSAESWVLDRLGLPTDPALQSEFGRLFHNTPDGWVDVTEEVGLDDVHATMGLTTGDFDADSVPDLYLSTGAPEYDALEPQAAYHNVGGRFLDVTPAMGTGSLQKGHGVSFGDVDEDGDQDLLVELGGAFVGDPAPNQLFVNPINEADDRARHAVTLRLEGVSGSRSALHARVRVVTASGDRWHVVGEAGSFGYSSLQLEVGLGDDDVVERVEIDWPAGGREVVEGVPADSVVSIREGEGVVGARPYAPVAIE